MDYKRLKVDELKEICSGLNLPIDGRKPDLIKKILTYQGLKGQELKFDTVEDNIPPKGDEPNVFLYIILNAANLSFYFNAGVIYPLIFETNLIYKNENRKRDLFNLNESYIPLFVFLSDQFQNHEIALEVFSNNLKVEKFNSDGTVVFLNEPLPVSRVNKIYFKSQETMSTFLSSVKTFPDFFIPDRMCQVISEQKNFEMFDFHAVQFPIDKQLGGWQEKLILFDKVMGMYSFIRNSGIFYAERTDQYQEYSPTYFGALSLINSKIHVDAPRQSALFRNILFPKDMDASTIQRFLFRSIIAIIYTEEEFTISTAETLITKALESGLGTLDEIAELKSILVFYKRLKEHRATFNELFRSGSIQKNFPLTALLFLSRFPNKSRQHTDKQAVRIIFITNEFEFNKTLSEFLLAILGIYYGYRFMIKSDTNLNIKDKFFVHLAQLQQSIKFRLETRLEKVTIESIFNWCKTQVTLDEDFYFLKNTPSPVAYSTDKAKTEEYTYVDKSMFIVDTKVAILERQSVRLRIMQDIGRKYASKISEKSLLLYYLIQQYGLSKEVLLDIIKLNPEKIDFAKIAILIDLDNPSSK